MEQTIHTPETYDFRKYDQIWRRVAPNLEPYPDLREPAVPAMAPLASGAAPRASQPPAGEDLEHLPGAEENPCCMGTMAQEELGVIEGFIEVELADRRTYQAFARRAPAFARGTMRDLANASGAAARRLMTAYYLITGNCYRPAGAVPCGGLQRHELPAGGGGDHRPLPGAAAEGAGRGILPSGGPADGPAGAGAVSGKRGRAPKKRRSPLFHGRKMCYTKS